MKLHVKVNEEDYLQYLLFFNWKSDYGKKAVKRIRLLIALMGILAAILVVLLYSKDGFFAIIGGLAVLIVFAFFWFFVPRFLEKLVHNEYRILLKTGKLPFDEEYDLEWDSEYLTETTPLSCQKFPLDKDIRTYVTSEYVFVFVRSNAGFFVPKREESDAVASLIACLKEKTTFSEA